MIYLIAVLLPFLALMLYGKIGQGILCLILQLTLIGWIPAVLWAVFVINNEKADRRTDRLVDAMQRRD